MISCNLPNFFRFIFCHPLPHIPLFIRAPCPIPSDVCSLSVLKKQMSASQPLVFLLLLLILANPRFRAPCPIPSDVCSLSVLEKQMSASQPLVFLLHRNILSHNLASVMIPGKNLLKINAINQQFSKYLPGRKYVILFPYTACSTRGSNRLFIIYRIHNARARHNQYDYTERIPTSYD